MSQRQRQEEVRRQRQEERAARRAERDAKRKEAERRAKEQQRLGIIGGVIIAAIAVAGLLIYLNRPPSTGEDLMIMASPIPAGVASSGRILGDPEAPVTIVEYGDYQCPFCGDFALEGLPQLIDEFVATGQASFEFRDLAFLGAESVWAAEAAACAEDQGAFWPYHETIYANQAGENLGAFAPDQLRAMASQLGLDMAAFDTCVDERTHEDTVAAMSAEAGEQGINSTPTFVINGQVTQYRGIDDLRAAITAALEQ